MTVLPRFWLVLVLSGFTCVAARAQQAPAASAPAAVSGGAGVGYAKVADALAAVQADPDIIRTDMDGWLVVQQPARNAQWSFTPAGHPAHPAVMLRTIRRQADGRRKVDSQLLCEGPAAACTELATEFARSSDRLQQYLSSRDSSSVPPAPRP